MFLVIFGCSTLLNTIEVCVTDRFGNVYKVKL